MKARIEKAFQGSTGVGPRGFGMMDSHGMIDPGFGPPRPTVPEPRTTLGGMPPGKRAGHIGSLE